MKIPKLDVIPIQLDNRNFDINGKAFIKTTTIILRDGGPGTVRPYNIITMFPNGRVQTIRYVPRDVNPELKEPEPVARCLGITTANGNTINLEYRTAVSGDMVIEYMAPYIQDQSRPIFHDKDGFILLSPAMYVECMKYTHNLDIGYTIYVKDDARDDKIVPSLVNAFMMLHGGAAEVYYRASVHSIAHVTATNAVATESVMRRIADELVDFTPHMGNMGNMMTFTMSAFTLEGRLGC